MHAQDLQACAFDILRTQRFHIDIPWSCVLRDKDGKALRALGVPIVHSPQDGILLVEVIIQYHEARRTEFEILLRRPFRPGNVDGCLRRAVVEFYCARSFLVSLRVPCVMLRRTISRNSQLSRCARFRAARNADHRLVVHHPCISGGLQIKFLRANLIALLENAELSLIRCERGIRRRRRISEPIVRSTTQEQSHEPQWGAPHRKASFHRFTCCGESPAPKLVRRLANGGSASIRATTLAGSSSPGTR